MGDELKVGETTYTPQMIEDMVASQQQMTQKLESFKSVEEIANQFGITPERLADETKGAFGALVQLQEAGILDEEGKIIQKKQEPIKPTPDPEPGKPVVPKPGGPDAETIAEQALAKLKPTLEELQGTIKQQQSALNRLYREKINDRVKQEGYEASDEDINLALATAQKTGKDFWEVLKGRVETHQEREKAAVEKFAKKHGLDMEKLNKLSEAKAHEGKLAQTIVEGKTISGKKIPGKDTVSPLEAMQELIRMNHPEGA